MVSGVCRDGLEEGTRAQLFIECLSGRLLQGKIACTVSHNIRLLGRRACAERWRGREGMGGRLCYISTQENTYMEEVN